MPEMKIGILGTRGIPNRYGGFEECAEKLSLGLAQRGHSVWVYSSVHHEYKGDEWNGVHIIHCKDPEPKMGTAGQFIYDYNCFADARKRGYDVLLQLGYTSSSIWWWRWPKAAINIINMDGLEWKRSKYSPKVQTFLKRAEKWAAIHGDALVADSKGIRQHLLSAFDKESTFIPYGAELFTSPVETVLKAYDLSAKKYFLLIARMEPENNIDTIIQGYLLSSRNYPLMIVGSTENVWGSALKAKYDGEAGLRFAGAIYDAGIINNLRYFSALYFHGHSVGGTNPSLLEAMACDALIAAHGNIFNEAVLGNDAFYFSDAAGVSVIIDQLDSGAKRTKWTVANQQKIRDQYSWPRIVDAYEQLMLDALAARKS